MLIAAAVCPHPPLLIPAALGAAASAPPQPLRPVLEACDRAVHGLVTAGPDLIVVVGGGPATREYGQDAAGSLRRFGVPVTVGKGDPVLPLSLTVGRWLLARAGLGCDRPGGTAATNTAGTRRPDGEPPAPSVLFQAVDERAPSAECQVLGRGLAERSGRVGLLAMGDASARRAQSAPGADDPEAMEYDDEVAEALAAADARWLTTLDPALDDTLAVAGRAAWQVLAGAATGRRFHGRLLCMATPYGVTYLVAAWDDPRAG